jgi:hypothetical protein
MAPVQLVRARMTHVWLARDADAPFSSGLKHGRAVKGATHALQVLANFQAA